MSVADAVPEDRRVPLPFGIASTIGSLPHPSHEAAVAFVLEHTPRLPAAPTLPIRFPREGMLAQAATGVVGIDVLDDGTLSLTPDLIDPAAPLGGGGFAHDPSFAGDRALVAAMQGATGFAKFQLTGPVTFAVALHALGLDPDRAVAVAGAVVRARATALLDWLGDVLPAVRPVVFVDEPAMVGLLQPGFPCDAETALDLCSSVLATLEGRAITGIHCCGEADWRLLLQAGPQILSLPLGAAVEQAAGTLSGYLERGGWLAWGAVPTDGPLGTTVERQWRKLSATWCNLVQEGCDPVRLRTQAMITPVCGLATHGIPQAEHVLELTVELAQRLHDQVDAVRLAAGRKIVALEDMQGLGQRQAAARGQRPAHDHQSVPRVEAEPLRTGNSRRVVWADQGNGSIRRRRRACVPSPLRRPRRL